MTITTTLFRWGLALLLLCLAVPSYAGFTVELDAAAAYAYDGTTCTSTGTHAGRTVPRCSGTADGTFVLRTFTQVAGSAPQITPQMVRFVTVGDPSDATAAACFTIACTATTEGSAPGTMTYNSGSTIDYDMDADSCTAQNVECMTGAGTAANIRNLQTGTDCASTACNNAELICRVRYNGTAGTGCTNGYTGGVDLSSIKLDVTP
jgi:hypothetical protein